MKHYISEKKELMEEWFFDENNKLKLYPDSITYGSNKKIWWKCKKCNYIWQTSVKNRTRKDGRATGCPNCKRESIASFQETPTKGKNDLYSQFPNLVKEWNYEKNKKNPSDYKIGSSQSVWWKCSKCNYEWKTEICNRTKEKGTGCPMCSAKHTGELNAKPILGVNDLATVHPNLIKEWDYEKNEKNPEDFRSKSNKKVWWKCSVCGYEWLAPIVSRCNGRGCKKCSYHMHISYPEKAIVFYLKKVYSVVEENAKFNFLGKRELDIYIPSLNLGIEYDGKKWHNTAKKDKEKDKICYDHNIKLIRIREDNLPKLNSTSIVYNMKGKYNVDNLEKSIKWLLDYLGVETKVDIEKDNISILKLMNLNYKDKTIVNTNKEILMEWDFKKNHGVMPDNFSYGSNKKVWWKCTKCGFSWQASIANRNNGRGCPNCSKYKKLIVGKNDYETLYPKLTLDWDKEKNGIELKYIEKKRYKDAFWWKCHICGYEWQLSIRSKIASIYCPKCSTSVGIETRKNNYLKKKGSLKSNFPEIANEWNYKKNGGLLPESVTCGTKRIVWWKCSLCGHEWENSVALRTKGFGKCPICRTLK